MARIFITGSTDGLGLATANSLIDKGHEVITHSRNEHRLSAVQHLVDKGAKAVIGDLSAFEEQCAVADQVNQLGQVDAIIHNAGIVSGKDVISVNVVAPYTLTALITKPSKLIYLSSSMHFGGSATLTNDDWLINTNDYSDSKLFVTTLANAISKRWNDVACFSVDPGWVPTKMGGKDAPDDLVEGYQTQEWLATANEMATPRSGTYWHNRQQLVPHRASLDVRFQDQLMEELVKVTGIRFPSR
ncbi:SDR family NAD(P)-dependent oxidoreductase [Rheinheimera mangrovi]|uniref:SDR family NAD(P)-dependent oxidoreductase n=1 Tax=Rheinheimera mangrovi TaxID=2498451 RepID=UPI000F8F435D|nr:SDR family NAD(P)-dependent oxidoreductase [Rheinheimera mangrovi]